MQYRWLLLLALGCASHETGRQGASLRQADDGELRSLEIIANTWFANRYVPQDGQSVSYSRANLKSASGPYSSLTKLEWVGDSNSYIDVFDVPIMDVDASGAFVPLYADEGSFARWPYPYGTAADGNTSPPMVHDIYPGAAGAFVNYDVRYGDWQALRVYDRGECSASTPWEAIYAGIQTQLIEGFAEFDLEVQSMSLTPRLHAQIAYDTFVVEATIVHPNFGDGAIGISFEGRFVIEEQTIVYKLLSLDVEGTGRLEEHAEDVQAALLGSDGVEASLTAGVQEAAATLGIVPDSFASQWINAFAAFCGGDRDEVPEVIGYECEVGEEGDAACADQMPGVLTGFYGYESLEWVLEARHFRCVPNPREEGGVCAVLPDLARVQHRADGVEIVVVDEQRVPFAGGTIANPWYEFLSDASPLCDRTPSQTVEGDNFGAITERPPVAGVRVRVRECPNLDP